MGGSSSSQAAPVAAASPAAAAVPTHKQRSDDSKIDDITIKLIEEERMSDEEYFEMIEKRKEKVEKTLADWDKNPNVKTYLAAIDSNISCDKEAFKMLTAAVKSSGEFYKLFSQLKEYGITKNEKYLDVLQRLLGLYQKEWQLLDDTLIKMKKLGGECEICYYNVKRFENEVNRLKMNNSNNNDIKPVPNTKLIKKSMNSLANWMKNTDEVKDVLNEWREFKNDVEKFKLDWNVVKDGIIEEIKKNCSGWCKRNEAKLCGAGGGLLGFTIALSFTHVITCVATLFFPIVGVVALASLVAVSAGRVAYRHYKARKQIYSAQEQMIDGIEKMDKRLKDMLQSSITIEDLCGKLDKSMVQQGIDTKIIRDSVEYQEWDDISYHLTRIEKSLKQFKFNCDEIEKEITQTQQSIIKIKRSQI